jgi:hypothetical protein
LNRAVKLHVSHSKHFIGCGERSLNRVADLVKHLVTMNPSAFQPGNGWTRESVAAVIRRILIEEAGVEDFDEDADFVRDLGID